MTRGYFGENEFEGSLVSKFNDSLKISTSNQDEAAEDNTSKVAHRYGSFVPTRFQNNVKWFVDGASYFWAVSVALEQAKHSIWILDWWLSPELYLRRPPAENEPYRLDRMLHAAAARGVKVQIIVYKEVSQALNLDSAHTKSHLENLHENIQVFRHPDHVPAKASLVDTFKSKVLKGGNLSDLDEDGAKTLYGTAGDHVLYWAHHEKMCVVDRRLAFMGGLDLCYGRWDTNQHGSADAHPSGPQANIIPGQDYNNARIADFKDVAHPEQNDVNRYVSSRMGWSDCSINISGPVVEDLRHHFVDRWNYIYETKYKRKGDDSEPSKYEPLTMYPEITHEDSDNEDDEEEKRKDEEEQAAKSGGFTGQIMNFIHSITGSGPAPEEKPEDEGPTTAPIDTDRIRTSRFGRRNGGPMACQLVRSASEWSAGIPLEHSIQNAYARVIRESEHFVYIENQFFITATGDKQKPVENLVGAAIVERILRAARNGEKYQMIVMIPSVPAFPGDLSADSALGTRAIMEFQYNSINRGGNSIMELIAAEGYNPMEYIRFYNLRSYDRINANREMLDTPQGAQSVSSPHPSFDTVAAAQMAQPDASTRPGPLDTVSDCYMLNGRDIREVPWEHDDVDEIDAFVSEELYIHTKLLIADDRTVLIGSANINDRSQLGSHDSEIALIIQDPTPVESIMDGQPYTASRFAASLRRHLCKKHLGLLPAQDYTNMGDWSQLVTTPIDYDFENRESKLVEDPLSLDFITLWTEQAHKNTQLFRKLFRPVPDDTVRTWDDYKDFYSYYFNEANSEAAQGLSVEQAAANEKNGIFEKRKKPAKYAWGHIIRDQFPGGVEEVKELLSQIRGTLVEMPLMFLVDEDMAKSGLMLNALTEPIYT